jgi:hypothetical protein
MIRLWSYNELADDLDPKSSHLSMYFPRPGGSTSRFKIKINEEIIESSAWGDWSLDDTVQGTFVDVGSTVDATRPLKRGIEGTMAERHRKNTPAWIEYKTGNLDPDVLTTVSPKQVPSPNDETHSVLAHKDGSFYVGGQHTNLHRVLARMDAFGNLNDTFQPDIEANTFPPANVAAMAVNEDLGLLVIGGEFDSIDGQALFRLAILDSDTGELVQGFNLGGSDQVFSIEWSENRVYVVGSFDLGLGPVGGLRLIHDGTEWVIDGSWDIGTDATVHTIEVGTQGIYIGGSFTTVRGSSRPGIALFDSSGDNLLSFSANVNGTVSAIAETEDYVYIGGSFSEVDGTSRDNLARLEYDASLDTGWVMNTNNTVLDIFPVTPTRLLVAGSFTEIMSEPAERLALIGEAGDVPHNFGLNATARQIAASGTRLLIVGEFTLPEEYLLVYDTTLMHSPIGRYKMEYDFLPMDREEVRSVDWIIRRNGETIITRTVDEFESIDRRLRIRGPQVFLPNPAAHYQIVARVHTNLRTHQEFLSFSSPTQDGIFLVPVSHRKGEELTASTDLEISVDKTGTKMYEVTVPDETPTPSMTPDRYRYRLYCLLIGEEPDRKGGNNLRITRSLGPVTENKVLPFTNLFEGEISWDDQSGDFDLTIRFEDTVSGEFVEETISHPGDQSDKLFPDQIQIERRVDTGTLVGPQNGRFISDWIDVPTGYVLVYANEGPDSYEYSFRVRYRNFREDGPDQRGPVTITTNWSDWSTPL